MEKTRIGRWESRGHRAWVELYRDAFGYTYRSDDGGGNLGALTSDAVAVAAIRVAVTVPDARRAQEYAAARRVTPG